MDEEGEGKEKSIGANRKALAVFGLVGDVDQEGQHAGVAVHDAHDGIDAEVHPLQNQGLIPRLTPGHQPLHPLYHRLALSLVPRWK